VSENWLRAISGHGLLLAVFAAVMTALIVLTWLLTSERIAAQQRLAELRALQELVPATRHDNDLLGDTLTLGPDAEGLGLRSERTAYRAYLAGEAVAVILPVRAPDGYNGSIDMIVAVNHDGRVAGVRVLAHRETPGLGDAIDLRKSDWILGFNGRSLEDPGPTGWAVRKDGGEFDAFTGATITPRAVVRAVHNALQYAAGQRAQLFAPPAPPAALDNAS